ncbi:MAG: phosphodiesterase [Paracoccaceae bacterium]
MYFIHLSDLHLSDPDSSVIARARADFVAHGLKQLAEAYPNAESCVITGDLADDGDAQVYTWLKELIADLSIPVDLLVGNHDDRMFLTKEFAGSGRFVGDFAQGTREASNATLVFLDTHMPNSDAGILCQKRLEWLDQTLKAAADSPVFLFMHHPPMDIGDPVMDPIKLKNPQDLARVLCGHHTVRHIFFGHVHRALQLDWNGFPSSCVDGISTAPDDTVVLNARVVTFRNDKIETSAISIRQSSRTEG